MENNLCPNRRTFVYKIGIITISDSVSDRDTKQLVLNIERKQQLTVPRTVLNAFCTTRKAYLEIYNFTRLAYELISAFAT